MKETKKTIQKINKFFINIINTKQHEKHETK